MAHESGRLDPSAISRQERGRLRLSQHQSAFDLDDVLAQGATRSRRYKEGYVAPGDRVHVYGGELAEDPDAPGIDAKIVGRDDGRYRITGGGESAVTWAFVAKAALTGFFALITVGGTITALAAL